jgi:hypothetical protein
MAGLPCFTEEAQAQNFALTSGPSGGTRYSLGAAIARVVENEILAKRVSVVNGVTVVPRRT